MIVTFCGHAHFSKSEEYEQKMLSFLEEKVGDKPADMYLGGYGDFDSFCLRLLQEVQGSAPESFAYIYNTLSNRRISEKSLGLSKDKVRFKSVYPMV